MDNEKIGQLIYQLRKEKGLTQKQLADEMLLSDRTISKWERGSGCPDISLLPQLSTLLEVPIEYLLVGEITLNEMVGGNMKKSLYYVCPNCTNIGLATGNFTISCCGRKLEPLEAKKATDTEKLSIVEIDNEWSISSEHPMTKAHYISFVAFATGEQIQLIKLFPEWSLNVRLPKKKHGQILWYDTNDGLFYQYIR
ncbi:XRE family transcriptional regulator [Solibacillus sp. R5-41]|uniref:helix-turn-helix domain-containing protein n=1 Tax=Solibacillus sp. R5-41 TaxID=2048654 RepID=UPI000C128E5D|nr:helix-turn-helix transcriptional regulator [Solibacillus sp. R5-41]ATP40328.1 XRE family transcriptional regulator [Solibacillus sp. R5-41]